MRALKYGAAPGFGAITFGPNHEVLVASGIVPDGWTDATVAGRRIAIEHNGIIVVGPYPKGTIVHFTGPAGAKQVKLG